MHNIDMLCLKLLGPNDHHHLQTTSFFLFCIMFELYPEICVYNEYIFIVKHETCCNFYIHGFQVSRLGMKVYLKVTKLIGGQIN